MIHPALLLSASFLVFSENNIYYPYYFFFSHLPIILYLLLPTGQDL